MTRRLKLFISLSTLAATGALATSACYGESEGEGGEGESPAGLAYGAESEGEGAESEGAALLADPATDDAEYISQLGAIEGHLIAFHELQAVGETDMAATHLKHPESEIYAALAPAFAARSQPGFAGELSGLVSAGEKGGDMDSAYAATISAIQGHIPDADVRTYLLAASKIAAKAAAEFDNGVDDDGAVAKPHEYQDAYGFLIAARKIVNLAQARAADEKEAVGVARKQIDLALAAFKGIAATSTEAAPSTLYGAAARLEIAALGLR